MKHNAKQTCACGKCKQLKGHKLIDAAEAELYFNNIKKPIYGFFKKKPKVVCVSGYFTCLHLGHLKLIAAAKQLGDELVVILNNDEQLLNNKEYTFVPALQRKEIMEALKGVDKVIIAVDKDDTVRETLRRLQPNVFANGGTKNLYNVPEVQVCLENGIELAWNIGD